MLRIREAGIEDIPRIHSLAHRTWPDAYGEILSKEQLEYMLDKIYSHTSLQTQFSSGHQFIIIEEDREALGFASYSELSKANWRLHKLYVLPNQQRKGFGLKLMDHLLEIIRSTDGSYLELNVNRFNKAKTFYEKIGFCILREEDIDIGDGYFMNDYIMYLQLK